MSIRNGFVYTDFCVMREVFSVAVPLADLERCSTVAEQHKLFSDAARKEWLEIAEDEANSIEVSFHYILKELPKPKGSGA